MFDATCPLVTKVHIEVAKLRREGYEFLMIGHKGHPEVEGTMGQLSEGIYLVEDIDDVAKVQVSNPDKLAVVTQTTLSVDDAAGILAAIKARFPNIREPKQQDICYATQNRQDAIKIMAPQVDVVIVVGSPTSSNSNRLRELAERLGLPPTWLIAQTTCRPPGSTAALGGPDRQCVGARRAGATSHRPFACPGRHLRAAHARRGRIGPIPSAQGLGGTGLDRPRPISVLLPNFSNP